MLEILKFFLDQGLDSNTKNAVGTTLLMHAAEGWETETIRLLISKGADVRLKDKYRRTIRYYVAELYSQVGPKSNSENSQEAWRRSEAGQLYEELWSVIWDEMERLKKRRKLKRSISKIRLKHKKSKKQ